MIFKKPDTSSKTCIEHRVPILLIPSVWQEKHHFFHPPENLLDALWISLWLSWCPSKMWKIETLNFEEFPRQKMQSSYPGCVHCTTTMQGTGRQDLDQITVGWKGGCTDWLGKPAKVTCHIPGTWYMHNAANGNELHV
jgi:hypothetical protein